MKGLKIAAVICAGVLMTATGAAANGTNLPAYRAAHGPAIDGVLDPLWYNAPWNRDFRVQNGANQWKGWTDGALSFRVLFDERYLYLFISLNDDTLVQDNDSSNAYHDDSIEIWFDGDNSKGTAYDGKDDLGLLFAVNPGDSTDWFRTAAGAFGSPAGLDLSGVLQAARRTALGLDFETAIPMEILGIHRTAGSLFGLEIDYNDDDNGDVRDTKIKYFSDQDESYRNPSTLGTVEIRDRVVGETLDVWYTETAPVINAVEDAMWANVPAVNLNHYMSDGITDFHDSAVSFRLSWDTEYLYCLIKGHDNVLTWCSRTNPPPESWENDCVELWLDGDNSKKSAFDGIDDRGFASLYTNLPGFFFSKLVPSTLPANDANNWPNLIQQASAQTEDGFIMEWALPLHPLGIEPLNHWKFGIEVDYDDDDNGLTRNTKWKTYSTEDNSWRNPGTLGTAELLGGPVADYVPPPPIPPVLNTTTVPAIDGRLDSAWVNVQPVPLGHVVEGTSANWWDSWAGYRMTWDETNVYLFITVHDDSVVTTHVDPAQNDGIVITMDGDNAKSAAYDGRDDDAIQFVFNQAPVNLTTYAKNANVDIWSYAWLRTSAGYNLEAAMPVKSGLKFVPAGSKPVGFDIQVNDNDTGSRDAMIKWGSNTATSPTPPSEMGTVQCAAKEVSSVLDIPFARTPILIDGEMDPGWDDALTVVTNYTLPQAASDQHGLRTPDDGQVVWKTMWNMDYLFFHFHIIDDTLMKSSKANAAGWESDVLEIWLDGDNSKKTAYDGINDNGFSFAFNPDTASGMSGAGHWNNGKIPAFDMTRIRQFSKIVDGGLILELALPIDPLGIEPGDGSSIGIEVDYNDNDGGTTRNTKIKTYSGVDDSWTDPSVMGTAVLTGSGVQSGAGAAAGAPHAFGLSQNYPNPFNPFTKIDYSVPAPGPVKLAVYNILGREVAVLINEAKPAGTHTVNFDASRLTSGIYICRIETAGKVQSKKLTLLK